MLAFQGTARADDDEGLAATARVTTRTRQGAPVEAKSRVSQRELEERLPRSSPEALRFEPGVSIQQTAHAQASPYVRGLTGQQVVHLFDGVRLNNGIYRQGPNQYLFTVDVLTLDHLDVERGSASVRYGADALGGAVLAVPRVALPRATRNAQGWWATPRLFGRYASQDDLFSGRVESGFGHTARTRVLVGAGYRDAGRLETAGVVKNPGANAPSIPRFEPDGRTQLGTGFRDVTFDGRVDQSLTREVTLSAAVYGYRQFDAPRTDQCPPREAPDTDCLRFDRQFRTLSYVTLRGDVSPWVEDLDLRLSLQRYSEALRRTRPSVEQRWHNEVTTEGLAVSARTRPQRFGDAALSFAYGADGYADVVRSRADQRFTDIDVAFDLSRGSYLDGSRYLTGGLFGQLVLDVTRFVELRGGARGAWVKASAPADPQSASRAIDADYAAAVAQAGVTLHAAEGVDVALNYDQGFRAPNLDDLTARQQVGPGFQFENDALRPERAHTLELGMHARHDVLSLDLWTFATFIEGAILRAPRTAQDCPAQTPACATSRELYQLVNAQTTSRIFGAEGGITLFLPQDITLRNVTSYAFGDGPRVPDGSAQGRGPLSRVPPLHGSLELRHRHLASGVYTTFALRWALRQDRLSVTDLGDARIPPGGTPGYAVLDLRAGYRMREHLVLSLSLDNLLDAPYRVHGSSINGPARGISAGVSMGY